MRWRFTDRVTHFTAWQTIRGLKTVSLEEYCLLERMGRKGSFPESLVVESCVHLCQWLVAASSGFTQSCTVQTIEQFSFPGSTEAGTVLPVAVEVQARTPGELQVTCAINTGSLSHGQGRLSLSLVPMNELFVPEAMETLWREIYVKA